MTSKKEKKGCPEYSGMSRRNFLGISGATAAALGLPSWFPQMAFSQAGSCPPCTVILFFGRGGWDGLTLCPPWNDNYYKTTRPVPNPPSNTDTLGFDDPTLLNVHSCLDLDGYFGLASALPGIHQEAWVTNQHLAIAHATGYSTNHSYSHFVGQHQLEVGQPNPPASLVSGWMGRHLQTRMTAAGCTDPIVRGLGYNVAKQRSIFGGTDCLASADPSNYNLTGSAATLNYRLDALRDMYIAEGVFDDVAQQTLNTILQFNTVDFTGYTSSNALGYPTTNLGNTFKTIATLIDAGQTHNSSLGIEVFAVDHGSWDTHNTQSPHLPTSPVGGGRMYQRMTEVDDAFTSFYLDMLGKGYNDYVIYGMSEFGRTNKENGSFGTDHAKGNAMMMLGPRVNGGQVYSNWDPAGMVNMVEGNDLNDLKITTDVRLIASELIDKCMGNAANLNTIFPGYTPGSYVNIFN